MQSATAVIERANRLLQRESELKQSVPQLEAKRAELVRDIRARQDVIAANEKVRCIFMLLAVALPDHELIYRHWLKDNKHAMRWSPNF